jgi:hypothetical protein
MALNFTERHGGLICGYRFLWIQRKDREERKGIQVLVFSSRS